MNHIHMEIKNYDDLIELLYKNQDLKYKDFHSKIIMSDNLIGVRTPILKDISKNLTSDYKSFIKYNRHQFYEDTIIHGIMLGYLKIDFNELLKLIDNFLPFINNWAICDITVSNLKQFKNNKELGFEKVKEYIISNNPWIKRFGYVILLNYYIDDNYIDEIFKLIKNSNEYYVKMSIAWLLSMCYIKYKDKTLKYLNTAPLDNWTYNKTIQKIIESNRIEKDEKENLKKLKK